MRKFSITDKLIIASFFLSVVIIMIVASYSFFNAKAAILDRAFNQLNSVRVIKTNLLETFFINSKNELQLAKSSLDVLKMIEKINQLDEADEYEWMEKSFFEKDKQLLNEISKDYYGNIFIIGLNKRIYPIKVQKDSDYSIDYAYLWEKTLSQDSVFIKDFTDLHPDRPSHIVISSKITNDKAAVKGIMVFDILPSAIDPIMLNKAPANGLGLSGESYLVGSDTLMRSSSRFQAHSLLKTKVNTEAVNLAFKGLAGTKVIDDYRGIKVLSSYSKISIPNLDWVIIAELDYKEVTIPVYKSRNEILFISIFIFLIVLIVIIVLSRKITYPIEKLNAAVKEVGKGNLEVKLRYNSNDEIGELSETFNKMIGQLKDQTKELEIEKKKRLKSLIGGQELERQRLSRELHDSLGQLIIGLKLKYESSLNNVSQNPSSFENLGLLFDQTIEETRRISNNLMPAALSEFGLTSAVRNICNDISENSGLQLHYQVEGTSKSLEQEVKIYLFRIIQEALTNIIKHSSAKNANISLNFGENFVLVNIEDDGKGFDKNAAKTFKSNGLNNINDRVLLLSGTFVIESALDQGTKLSIQIPINKEQNG